ncbi:MAG: hypothetical protein PVJ21_14610 [Anaerolineales bacterium]|jgi:hypothetical protein
MTKKHMDPPIIVFSVKVYQALLAAYPARFRQIYGSHMLQVFRDCCLRAFRQNGTNGVLNLWALTLFDLLRSLIEEYLQKETFMMKSKFIRLSGWSLMIGAVTFTISTLSALVESNFYDSYMRLNVFVFYNTGLVLALWISTVLLAVGELGLRARYGEQVGFSGKNFLLIGAIAGPAIGLLGVIGAVAKVLTWAEFLLYSGNMVLLACLTIFGISALRTRPLPRWNGLPLIAGFWFPVLLPAMMIANANGAPGSLVLNIANGVLLLQSIALFILGYMLQANVSEEIPAIA